MHRFPRRFDDQALIPPQAPPDELGCLAAEAMALLPIEGWCRQGEALFAEAVLVVADDRRRQALAQMAARRLDGSHRLESLRPLAAWVWRLQVLLADRRDRLPPQHPWDAGWASAERARWLGEGFVPRRPTLVLADVVAAGLATRGNEAVPLEPGHPVALAAAVQALQVARDGLARRLGAACSPAAAWGNSATEPLAEAAPAAADPGRLRPLRGRVVRWLWLADADSAGACAPTSAPRIAVDPCGPVRG